MNVERRSSAFSAVALVLAGGPASRRANAAAILGSDCGGHGGVDAAVGVGVPQAVGHRWFREEGQGHAAIEDRLSAKPLCGRVGLVSGARRRSRSFAFSLHAEDEHLARLGQIDIDDLRLRRDPATRSSDLAYRATTAQWHASALLAAKAGEAARNTGLRPMSGTVRWRFVAGPGSCYRPGRVLEKPSARTAEGPAMGERLEPGPVRPSPCRWTARTARPCASP